jgi:UDP-N-acetylglucosamine--N-acetylmuramyl-(pentapeptide) pyrophosphoryl-undecaprenol N-acetylglucosamine transferase
MLGQAGGAIVMEQTHFTPDRVAAEIARLAAAPEKLAKMAAAARGQGILDGADRLADLVMTVAPMRVNLTEKRSNDPGIAAAGKPDGN